ncbi:hypothetical protein AKO1_002166, partial [Acrasis kona]
MFSRCLFLLYVVCYAYCYVAIDTSPLNFGMSSSFLTSNHAIDMRDGIRAGFLEANYRYGGVAGRQMILVDVEDEGNSSIALKNTKNLYQNSSIIGLMGYTQSQSLIYSAEEA